MYVILLEIKNFEVYKHVNNNNNNQGPSEKLRGPGQLAFLRSQKKDKNTYLIIKY